MSSISIVLADDHTLIRQGLRALLEGEPDITVVGDAADGCEAVRLVKKLRPDVVVMDVAMPTMNGLGATLQIRKACPSVKVIILSSFAEAAYVRRLVGAGASGYLVKHSAAQELVDSIRQVMRGRSFFSPSIPARHYQKISGTALRESRQPNSFTARQLSVLQMIAQGFANKQIAARLSISVKTVEKHRDHIIKKLDIHEIAGLTRYAVSHGIVACSIDSGGDAGKAGGSVSVGFQSDSLVHHSKG